VHRIWDAELASAFQRLPIQGALHIRLMSHAHLLCTGPIGGAVSLGKNRVLVSVQGDGVTCYDVTTRVSWERCWGGGVQQWRYACVMRLPIADREAALPPTRPFPACMHRSCTQCMLTLLILSSPRP
jgi:hypothetical protein